MLRLYSVRCEVLSSVIHIHREAHKHPYFILFNYDLGTVGLKAVLATYGVRHRGCVALRADTRGLAFLLMVVRVDRTAVPCISSRY